MDAANTSASTEQAKAGHAGDNAPIEVTWASTASHERLGKIWAPKGRWPVTPGVQRLSYAFEQPSYPNFTAFDKHGLAVDAEELSGGEMEDL